MLRNQERIWDKFHLVIQVLKAIHYMHKLISHQQRLISFELIQVGIKLDCGSF